MAYARSLRLLSTDKSQLIDWRGADPCQETTKSLCRSDLVVVEALNVITVHCMTSKPFHAYCLAADVPQVPFKIENTRTFHV